MDVLCKQSMEIKATWTCESEKMGEEDGALPRSLLQQVVLVAVRADSHLDTGLWEHTAQCVS